MSFEIVKGRLTLLCPLEAARPPVDFEERENPFSADQDTKCPRAARRPVSFCTSRMFYGGHISRTRCILAGLASMPRFDTKKLRSLPA